MTSLRSIATLLCMLLAIASAKDAATMIKNAFLKNKNQVVNTIES